MADTTTSSGLEQLATTYFSKVAQDRLVKNFVFYHACDKRRVPKNAGKTYQFYRFDNVTGSTTALAETTLTAGQVQLSARSTTLTLNQYGQFMTVSNFAQLVERTDFLKAGAEVLADAASDTVDLLTKSVLDSNAAAHVVNQGSNYLQASASASLTATDVVDSAVLKKVRRDLRSVNARPFADGKCFMGIFGPEVIFDIFADDTVGGFGQTHQYIQPEKITDADAGKLWQIRILESTQIGSTANGSSVDVYDSYVVASHALVAVNLYQNPIQILVKEPGSGGTSDPYDNIGTVAYKLPVFGVSWQGGDGALVKSNMARAFRVYSGATA